jgi:hypothetical protein
MLPQELLQIILRYAISVPVFLDVEAVDTISPLMINYPNIEWNRSKLYWTAERNLNKLRRVCRSWNFYLCQYEHRFVRMFDVAHGVIPAHYLQSAIRISLGGHIKACCGKCKIEPFWPCGEEDLHVYDGYQKLCQRVLHQFRPLKVQIMDFGNSDFYMSELLCSISPSAFLNLVIVQAAYIAELQTVSELISSLPSLRHCFVKCRWGYNDDVSLKSSTLTTLFFPFRRSTEPFECFMEGKMYLPALRHLYMTIYGYQGVFGVYDTSWLALLKNVGKELRSLYLPVHGHLGIELPEDIWRLCPKLELLHTSMKLGAAPPPDHPLHTLSIPNICFQDGCSLPNCIPDWPRIRTIRINGQWARLLDRLRLGCLDPRLRVEDAFGESYSEHISRVGSVPE